MEEDEEKGKVEEERRRAELTMGGDISSVGCVSGVGG